jgi:hypothetical protein
MRQLNCDGTALQAVARRLSRREVWKTVLAGLLPLGLRARPLLGVDLVSRRTEQDGIRWFHRQYRADAVILLFGMPIFHRAGVGSGYTAIGQATGVDNSSSVEIDFGAGSLPERTRGLNRQGFIREVVWERNGTPEEAAYFGALVSSGEEDLDHARQALADPPKDAVFYKAIDGRHRPGHSQSAQAGFSFPANYTWSQRERLFDAARESFPPVVHWRENAWPGDEAAPDTFLYALRKAVEAPESAAESSYVYNERNFRLQVEKSADVRAGREFHERGLTEHPERVISVRGRTLETKSGKHSTFQLWVERPADNPLPIRFEYQPKSFLRLAFEFDPNLQNDNTRRSYGDDRLPFLLEGSQRVETF